jgi:hypothetical protein
MKEHQVGIRFPKKDVKLIKKIVNLRGEDMSDFIRRAVYKELAKLGYLPKTRQKALGMSPLLNR